MKWIRIVGLALLGFQLVSCDTESPLEYDYEQVVVEAYLFAGQKIDDIHLTRTIPMGDETATSQPINDAVVRLIKNDKTYVLTLSSGDSGYYQYEGDDLSVLTGDLFTLEVDYFDRTTTGSTTVPTSPNIISQSNDTLLIPKFVNPDEFQYDSTKNQIRVRWEAESDALYFVTINSMEQQPDSVKSRTPPKGMPGRMISLPQNQNWYIVLFEDLLVYGRHELKIYRINKEYVDLYISRNQNSRELNEPITNIENGLGVFSAFNSVSVYFMAVGQENI